MENQLNTFKDVPLSNVDEDLLGGKKYSEGLAKYIRLCETPMTIALQGDWGSGKTSMMNMIKSYLVGQTDETIHTVWFNTWQFSQFHSKDDLPINFLSCLVEKIREIHSEVGKGKGDSLLKKIDILKMVQISKAAAWAMWEEVAPKTIAAASKAAVATIESDDSKEREPSIADIISTLKVELQEWINEKLSSKDDKPGGRIVVFVDDLDRLEPLRAVELLEILKLFMDLENCVYVLAIDYDVVVRGVKDKYGSDFSEEKGRAFFEKIIQLPFKMPVYSYDIDHYIDSLLKELGINTSKEADVSRFIKNIIGTNPRTMKRLFNAFSLLRIIGVDESVTTKEEIKQKHSLILLGLLCLQMNVEQLYNFVLALRSDLEKDTFKILTNDSYEDLYNSDSGYAEIFEACDINSDFWNDNVRVLKDLITLIASDKSKELNNEELVVLRSILEVSTMTSSGNVVKEVRQKSGEGRGARRTDTKYQSEPKQFAVSIKMQEIKAENDDIGLDKCQFKSFQFKEDDIPTEVNNGNDLIQKVLSRICQKDPDAFLKFKEVTEERGLKSFFYGTGNPPTIKAMGYVDTGKAEESKIPIELKNGAGRKIELICQIMKALDLNPEDLKYTVILKEYIK